MLTQRNLHLSFPDPSFGFCGLWENPILYRSPHLSFSRMDRSFSETLYENSESRSHSMTIGRLSPKNTIVWEWNVTSICHFKSGSGCWDDNRTGGQIPLDNTIEVVLDRRYFCTVEDQRIRTKHIAYERQNVASHVAQITVHTQTSVPSSGYQWFLWWAGRRKKCLSLELARRKAYLYR
jgi:hypothetical protein